MAQVKHSDLCAVAALMVGRPLEPEEAARIRVWMHGREVAPEDAELIGELAGAVRG